MSTTDTLAARVEALSAIATRQREQPETCSIAVLWVALPSPGKFPKTSQNFRPW